MSRCFFEELSTVKLQTQPEESLNHLLLKMEKGQIFGNLLQVFLKPLLSRSCSEKGTEHLMGGRHAAAGTRQEHISDSLESEAACLWGFIIRPHDAYKDDMVSCPCQKAQDPHLEDGEAPEEEEAN